MESNWRFNVWEEGLWGLPVGLFARSLSNPNLAVSKNDPAILFKASLWTRPAPGQLWVAVLGIDPPGNFPYGFAVEPDH